MITQTLSQGDLCLTPTLTPIVRELPADLETPVSVYLKLAGSGPSFLLESVTGGEQLARYSFIGLHPSRAYVFQGGGLQIHSNTSAGWKISSQVLPADQDPLDVLRGLFSMQCYQPVPGLPRFAGGFVGYLSYELMRYFEPSVQLSAHTELPDAIFLQADTVIAFDHAFGRLLLIGNAYLDGENGSSPAAIETQLDEIMDRLAAPMPDQASSKDLLRRKEDRANMTRQEFVEAVQAAKEYISAGDIYQVVLSQRISRETHAGPFNIYRALRRLNPSPYMFYFDFADLNGVGPMHLIGASPEMHARLEGRVATVRPIAGTRKRGKTPVEDASLESDLLADPKELAEHVMLVDLGRNDLGRICEYGSVQVSEKMVVERYSHVMHIASHVKGEVRPGYDAFDVLRATFPAGTVSGAPKIRAMQIIKELEVEPRGPYAGAVGYFSYDGCMDTCITIRTMVMQGQIVSMQAGAGIVADSDPWKEYQETLNKLRALAVAIDMAEREVAT